MNCPPNYYAPSPGSVHVNHVLLALFLTKELHIAQDAMMVNIFSIIYAILVVQDIILNLDQLNALYVQQEHFLKEVLIHVHFAQLEDIQREELINVVFVLQVLILIEVQVLVQNAMLDIILGEKLLDA